MKINKYNIIKKITPYILNQNAFFVDRFGVTRKQHIFYTPFMVKIGGIPKRIYVNFYKMECFIRHKNRNVPIEVEDNDNFHLLNKVEYFDSINKDEYFNKMKKSYLSMAYNKNHF